MQKITPVDIQHKSFKKALQGYDRADVDGFLDEVIETLEDEAQQRAALEAEIADLKERISHFKAMEESLQNTLVLAQRTADETKASAHKEADLIREKARLAGEREIAGYNDAIAEVRREHQRTVEAAEKARSELRSLLMTHLALLERVDGPAARTASRRVAALRSPSRSPKSCAERRHDPHHRLLVRVAHRRAARGRHRPRGHARRRCAFCAACVPTSSALKESSAAPRWRAGFPRCPTRRARSATRATRFSSAASACREYEGKPLPERPEYALFLLRRDYELFANLRPVRVFPGLEEASSLRPEIVRGLDLIVVRELTGGIYYGKPKEQRSVDGVDEAVDTMIYRAPEVERIARVAFELARARRKP